MSKSEIKTNLEGGEFRQEVVELIDGVPVVPLETALRFVGRVHEVFPDWGVYLPYNSVVQETMFDAMAQYSQFVQSRLGTEQDLDSSVDFGFYSRNVPDIEELKSKYAEDIFMSHSLELELTIVRVKVKEALQIVYNRAFSPLGYDVDPFELNAFRQQFTIAMQKMGITYDPVQVAVVHASRDPDKVWTEQISSGMPDGKNSLK